MEFWIFGCLSVLAVAAAVIWVRRSGRGKKEILGSLSRLNQFTIGVFAAAVLMFIPVYYHWEEWGDDYHFLRPLLLAVVGAMQAFLLNVDFDIVEKTVPTDPMQLRVFFCLYAACIYFLAPVLTFTNVLSMFRNFTGEVRLRMSRRRPIYIMSELNLQSVTMAEQVSNMNRAKDKEALIVFAGVNHQNDKPDYSLIHRIRKLNAVCLKKDAGNIEFPPKGEPVEIFLMGKNETENTSQAITLTDKYRNSARKVSVFVYSTEAYTDNILDSLEKGNQLLHEDILKRIRENPGQFLFEDGWAEEKLKVSGGFCLRRVDLVDTMIMEVLTRANYKDYKAVFDAAEQDKTVSITVLGMGRYGTHFLKTAVWFYQRFGYRVECNVIELGKENGNPEKRIGQECPELIKYPNADQDGEAKYHIRFFNDTDCLGSDFDDLILKKEPKHFLKTKLVFVALGDDDRNIQASMHIRSLFDRLWIQSGKTPDSLPFIYALVYDDQKVSNMDAEKIQELHNHKGEKYLIHFLSTLATQYSYDVIDRYRDQERDAFKYHLDWTRKETRLRTCYEDAVKGETHRADYAECQKFREALDKEQRELGLDAVAWGDEEFFSFKQPDDTVVLDYDGPINTEELENTAGQYVRYSYCRRSSIAKARHKEAMGILTHSREKHPDICSCEDCNQTRITEHMRWNAYMRSLGYCYSTYTGDNKYRAKLHRDLLPWEKLPLRERYKD